MKPIEVLYLAGPGPESEILYHALASRFFIPLVIQEAPRSRLKLLERRLRRQGLRKTLGQVAFQTGLVPLLRKKGAPRIKEILKSQGLRTGPMDQSHIEEVSSLNSEMARRILARRRPDMVVINGTSILSKETLKKLSAPVLNTHVGITPQYRGVHGGYWALRNRDWERFGVTVHLVDPGIDTGVILAQALCESTESDNFSTYPYLQLARGIPVLIDVIQQLHEGRAQRQECDPSGTPLWSHPTIFEYLQGRLLEGVR